jgi:hypothetical protein
LGDFWNATMVYHQIPIFPTFSLLKLLFGAIPHLQTPFSDAPSRVPAWHRGDR